MVDIQYSTVVLPGRSPCVVLRSVGVQIAMARWRDGEMAMARLPSSKSLTYPVQKESSYPCLKSSACGVALTWQ